MKKYAVSIKSCYNFKKILLVLFNATAESVNCLPLKNRRKSFRNSTYKKNLSNTLKIYWKSYLLKSYLPQHLLEKFIGDNLSITDIALSN